VDSHKIDTNSSTWLAVKAKADAEIKRSSGIIERRGADPIKTEFERGVIAAMRSLLGLPKAQ